MNTESKEVRSYVGDVEAGAVAHCHEENTHRDVD